MKSRRRGHLHKVRALLCLLLLPAFVSSAAGGTAQVAAPISPMKSKPGKPQPEARLHEFARRYTAAWCSQDAASVAAFFSPNGSLAINGGAPAVGRTAIAQAARGFMTAFPDLQITMDDLLDQGGKVIYKWTLSGTNTGPGGTGQRVHISGYEEWRIGSDSLVAESLGHYDSAEYQRQLEHGAAGKK